MSTANSDRDREARTAALLEALDERVLVLDGATGTAFQAMELSALISIANKHRLTACHARRLGKYVRPFFLRNPSHHQIR